MSERETHRLRSIDKTVKTGPDVSGGLAVARQFFRPPDRDFTRTLEAYRDVLHAVHPLRSRHRASLPMDVRRLSESLTSERGQGPRPNYLADPSNLSAYLSYFLPWNLLRQGLLFTGLEFDLPDGARILDMGAGPLTVAQALWMSRPGLRGRRLAFVCLDQTGSVLRTGRALFDALAGEAGRAWSFELVQGPLHKAPGGPFDLVTAANCLNEAGGGRGQEGRQGLARLAELLARRLAPEGRLLLAEPGTRLGGGLLGRMREELLELDLRTLAPCTHDEPCPLLDPRRRSWCHFTAQSFGSPTWLAKLSHAAGLPKDRLSLSFLLMSEAAPRREERLARVVSSSFALPVGGGVYGCCDQGLAVLAFLRRPQGLESGALARLPGVLGDERDPKTGAVVVPLDRESRRDPQPEGAQAADRRVKESDPVRELDAPRTGRTGSASPELDVSRGRGEPKGRDFRRGADDQNFSPPRGREEPGDRPPRRGRDESVSRDRRSGADDTNSRTGRHRPADAQGPAGRHGPDRRHGSDRRPGPERTNKPDGQGGPSGQGGPDGRDKVDGRDKSDGRTRPEGPRPGARSGPGDRDRAPRPFARPRRRPVSGQGGQETGDGRPRSDRSRSERNQSDRPRSGQEGPQSDSDRRPARRDGRESENS